MFETKYSKFLTITLIVIIVAIIGLGGFLGYNYYTNYQIDKDSDKYVETFIESFEREDTSNTGDVEKPTNTDNTDDQGSLSDVINSIESTETNGKKQKQYKGFNVIGTIEIPKTSIKYPVLEMTSAKSIEVAVAALYPVDAKLNTEGNVVIIGHNYRNGLFFSDNKKLSNGDKIYITDLDGKKVTYTIYDTFRAEPNDTSFYNRDTDGAMEITLSTCTDDSSSRIIILARAE